MSEELTQKCINAVEKVWTALSVLQDYCGTQQKEDLNIAITAIERLRLKLLTKYYVFERENCGGVYCAQVKNLQRILDAGCQCRGNHKRWLAFVNIVTEPPPGSTVLEYMEE